MSNLRLLPWSSPDGKPAYLATDDPSGFLSVLADRVESEQLSAGADVLRLALDMLDSMERLSADELHFVTRRLSECLRDALRVAESRGHRLPVVDQP